MVELSIALVLIAAMAFYLVNKFLDQKYQLNTNTSNEALSAATVELSKAFDNRINKCFENHQLIKSELDSLKLQIGIKGKM